VIGGSASISSKRALRVLGGVDLDRQHGHVAAHAESRSPVRAQCATLESTDAVSGKVAQAASHAPDAHELEVQ